MKNEQRAAKPETIFEQLVVSLIVKAAQGDLAVFKELTDSAFGKITNKVENKITFKQMRRVTLDGAELIFDVGSEPKLSD